MKEYFFLSNKVKKGTAYAYTIDETIVSHEIIPELKTLYEIPFELALKDVSLKRGELQLSDNLTNVKHLWLDYQPNNLAFPLMSVKMKNIISNNLSGKEGVVWMKVLVNSQSEKKVYFIPRFEKKLDVLDEENTIYVTDHSFIVEPVFSLTKVANYNVFFLPQDYWEIPSGLYVSEKVKNAIQEQRLTGVDFEKVRIV